jgi:hypothetical protein
MALAPVARATGWTVTASPNVGGQDNVLASVAAAARNDVWAVGQFAPDANPNITQTLTEHFDGNAWTVVPSPNVGARANALLSVTAKAGRVWAVGYYFDDGFAPRSLIERWDGAQWTVVPHPQPRASDWLFSISAVSANEVWAVGFQRDHFGTFSTLIERFDGKEWSIVPSPNPGARGNQLYSVSANGPADVWAVGQEVGLRGPDRALALHWDGVCWSTVATARERHVATLLLSVAVANGAPLAVGDAQDNATNPQVLAERGEGAQLVAAGAVNMGAGENHLYGVGAHGKDASFAVGGFVDPASGNFNTLIERVDGSQFTVVPSPNATTDGNNLLSSVAIIDSTEAWAVGTFDGANAEQTLILHFMQ